MRAFSLLPLAAGLSLLLGGVPAIAEVPAPPVPKDRSCQTTLAFPRWLEQFKKEELLLLNGLYPNKTPQPGEYVKVIE